jgi:cytochrome c oxidase subunit 2
MNWSWILPPSASTFAPEIDRMYYIILVITGAVFVLTEVLLLWFVFRYRHREGRKAEYIHGNVTAEVIWTAVPFFIVIWIALASRGVWASIKDPANIPANALDVRVAAKQFEWNVSYAGADGALGTADDFTTRNRLEVPVGRPIRVLLTAEDVIHSFWLREHRVKQDAVPGMEIQVWFEATETGEYPIGCAELCGTGHTRMRGTLVVHTPESYQQWLNERTAPPAQPAAAPAQPAAPATPPQP